jgi:hypothetical protein
VLPPKVKDSGTHWIGIIIGLGANLSVSCPGVRLEVLTVVTMKNGVF